MIWFRVGLIVVMYLMGFWGSVLYGKYIEKRDKVDRTNAYVSALVVGGIGFLGFVPCGMAMVVVLPIRLIIAFKRKEWKYFFFKVIMWSVIGGFIIIAMNWSNPRIH